MMLSQNLYEINPTWRGWEQPARSDGRAHQAAASECSHKLELGYFWWKLLFRVSNRNICVYSIILFNFEYCSKCFWCTLLHRKDCKNYISFKIQKETLIF